MSSLSVIAGAGIIVTGSGNPADNPTATTVELIREDGTTCSLPNLPQGRYAHTQAGLVACGGYGTYMTCTKLITSTWAAGTWARSHNLTVGRLYHVSWASYPGGVLLLGGWNNDEAKRSTELLSSTTPQFGLAYDTE